MGIPTHTPLTPGQLSGQSTPAQTAAFLKQPRLAGERACRSACRSTCWCLLVLLAALVSCAEDPAAPELRVAFSLLVTTESGELTLRGARLALDEHEGIVAGRRVELVVFNTLDSKGNDPLSQRLERAAAQAAIDDPQVVAYLGPMTSDQAKISMALLNRAGLAQINFLSTWPGLTRAGFGAGEPGIYYPTGRRHFFRLVATDDVQAQAAARWARELGFEAVFLVDHGLGYGRGLAGIFEETARDLGVEIVGRASLPVGVAGDQLDEVIVAIEKARPDLVFYGGGIESHAFSIIPRLREELPHLSVMGPDGIQRPGLIERLGPALSEGILATDVAPPIELANSPQAERFRRRYEELYGTPPPPLASGAYEAMNVALQAIGAAEEPTRKGVLAALHQLNSIDGLLGPWSFDKRGDLSQPTLCGYRVEGGRWVLVKVLR